MKKNVQKIDDVSIIDDNKVQCKRSYSDKFKDGKNYELIDRDSGHVKLKYNRDGKSIKFRMSIPSFYKHFTKVSSNEKIQVTRTLYKDKIKDKDTFEPFGDEWDDVDVNELFIYKVLTNNDVIMGYVVADNQETAMINSKVSKITISHLPDNLFKTEKICSINDHRIIGLIKVNEKRRLNDSIKRYKSIETIFLKK